MKGIYVTPQMVSSIRDGRASIKPTGEEDIYDTMRCINRSNRTEYRNTSLLNRLVFRLNVGKLLPKAQEHSRTFRVYLPEETVQADRLQLLRQLQLQKSVAANIDEYLGYHHEISCDVEIPEAHLDDRTPCGRVNLTEREACERVCDFEAVYSRK